MGWSDQGKCDKTWHITRMGENRNEQKWVRRYGWTAWKKDPPWKFRACVGRYHKGHYLLTYSMEQRPSWEANKFSESQKKLPAFYGTRRFITVVISARHLSLSWARSIQSILPHPTSLRSILTLSFHLRLGLPSGLFRSGFPTKTLYTPLLSPTHATCPAHFSSRFYHPNNMGWEVQIIKLLIM